MRPKCTLYNQYILAVVSSPSPVSGMPLNLKLPLREYCSTLSHSPSSRSTLSSRAVICFSLRSSWDVRPAIVRVSLSSLSDSAWGYKADLKVLSTPSHSVAQRTSSPSPHSVTDITVNDTGGLSYFWHIYFSKLPSPRNVRSHATAAILDLFFIDWSSRCSVNATCLST